MGKDKNKTICNFVFIVFTMKQLKLKHDNNNIV